MKKRKQLTVEFVNPEELPSIAKELTVLLCQLYLDKKLQESLKQLSKTNKDIREIKK